MLNRIQSYFRTKMLPIEERDKKYPKCKYYHCTNTRKTGLSTNELDPKHILSIIKTYFTTLEPNTQRYNWLKIWLPVIESELLHLSKYKNDELAKILIIHDDLLIMEFYLIYDIHICDEEVVYINLNQCSSASSNKSSVITSLAVASSIGTLGYFLSNLL